MVKESNRNSDIYPVFPYGNAIHCFGNWSMSIKVIIVKNRTISKYNNYLGSVVHWGFSPIV